MKDIFFLTSSHIIFIDIKDLVYLARIDIPAITYRKIENTIFKLTLDKAPGMDNIPNQVLRKITLLIFLYLYKLFNNYVNLPYYLHHFEKSITIILHKLFNKKFYNYIFTKVHKSIALLNTLNKALESILVICINDLVETYVLLPDMHSEGRKSRSTKDFLYKIVEKI